MSILLGEQMLVLFAILAIGSWLGGLSFKGITLGSAGVLFIAMIFGHFGLGVPRAVMDLGLLLFVYAVGLQAGPSFFRTFRSRGIQYVIIGLAAVLAGGIATLVVAASLHLPYDLASGLFTGALTCTPALASAVDVFERIAPGSSGNVSVGYGIAYPFSMIGVVLLVQFLPRMLGKNIRDEENRWKHERQAEAPSMLAKTFLISNPNLDGRSLSEINPHRLSQANISRIKHGDQVYSVVPDRVVHLDDVVMVVGTEEELSKMRLLLGEETVTRMDMNTSVVSMDIEVVEDSLVGKKLKDMRVFERYNVVITRIRRQGVELAPNGDTTLEMGDSIRVVGDQDATREFARLVHGSEGRADETNMAPFLAGLLLGILIGVIPVNLPNGLVVRLGASGGAFLMSLLLGHFGRVGPLRLYVPVAARNLSRELGLMLFLAGAGANAGSHFVQVFQQQGVVLVLAGIAIAAASALVALVLMNSLYKMNILSTLGALCACMTNPPGLSAANEQTETELPTVAYASVYPVALIFKIVLAQILVEVLRSTL